MVPHSHPARWGLSILCPFYRGGQWRHRARAQPWLQAQCFAHAGRQDSGDGAGGIQACHEGQEIERGDKTRRVGLGLARVLPPRGFSSRRLPGSVPPVGLVTLVTFMASVPAPPTSAMQGFHGARQLLSRGWPGLQHSVRKKSWLPPPPGAYRCCPCCPRRSVLPS